MGSENIFGAAYSVLSTINLPLALFCFIKAGLNLRGEGGTNFDATGGFFKWLIWGCILLTLTQIQHWVAGEGIGISSTLSPYAASYAVPISTGITDFIQNIVLNQFVPVAAGALVIKALLDSAEGKNPIASLVAAIFLLGISGFYTEAELWNDGSSLATGDMLKSMLNWAMNSVCPVIGTLCVFGAVIQFARSQKYLSLALTGLGFFSILGLWSLLQSWTGARIS